MTGSSVPSVCLCVPTFRRPDGLRKLLEHVERLNYAGRFEIIVVDNDAEARGGATVVEEYLADISFPAHLHRRAPSRSHLRV